MKTNTIAKWIALGGMVIAFFAVLALTPGARPRSAEATMNPLPPLIACPNIDASTDTGGPAGTLGKVTVADIVSAIAHFNKNYGTAGYGPLWDLVAPYNSTSPAGTGSDNVGDIIYVIQQFNHFCPLMDTQIATATRAIADPMFSSKLCDDAGAVKYQNVVNCGGDPRFLIEHPPCITNDPDPDCGFLTSKGYRRGSTDVPGQGIHYVNFDLWNGVFNPARPPGLVYKNGALVAQLYYAAGDSNATIGGSAGVGWGSNQSGDLRGVNTDAFCTPVPQEPSGTGCSWDGSHDGFHWHANLCTLDIGSTSAIAIPGLDSSSCTTFGGTGSGQWNHSTGITCTWYPNPGWNCTWAPAVGWMGHLWNWLPNANYTLGASPGPTCVHCASFENNGRFADCNPDGGFSAYSCPQ